MQHPALFKALAELNTVIGKDFESCVFQKDKSGYLSIYLNGKLQAQLHVSNGEAVVSIPKVEQHLPAINVKPDFTPKPGEGAQSVPTPKPQTKLEDIVLSAIGPGRRRAVEIQNYLFHIKGMKTLTKAKVAESIKSLASQGLVETRGTFWFTVDEPAGTPTSQVSALLHDWRNGKGAFKDNKVDVLNGFTVKAMGYATTHQVGLSNLTGLCRSGVLEQVKKGHYRLKK